jgi:predicted Ser/Thr protein kinase/dienelactone hydrolase
MIGQTISHYRIAKKLGEGGMGVVYEAEDTKLGRPVALKFLPEGVAQDEASRKRFLYEARAAAALNHSNICTVYEIDEELGFLAMEYIDGETVEAKRKRRPLPIEEALDIAIQTATGLRVAHEKGIVHRDIKSANLMVTTEGQVKVMDFGLARLSNRTRMTRTGSSLGTPAYMAPETFRGDEADERSDIWSLGVVIHEMIAGRLPFDADSEAALLYAVLNKEPEPLTALRTDVPLELDRIVRKTLAKDRGSRYQHVDDLAVDLKALRRGGLPSPAKASPPKAKGWKMAAIAAAALLAVGAAGFWTWRERSRIAHETAVRQVETLADAGAMIEAYRLAQVLDERNPNDPAMQRVWEAVGPAREILTDPPGADVYIRDYLQPESEWIRLGQSPLKPGRLPYLFLSLRITKEGYSDVEWALRPVVVPPVKLTPTESTPPGMVFVMGTGRPGQPVPLDDFWLDRYETTNAEYKKFVDAGGYRDRKFWKQPFVEGNRVLGWDEAMARFQDSTGRPGPAHWDLGSYPEGAANLPVAGVSWFEAAAYAEFAGKELPTVHHWRQAAIFQSISSEIVLLSNFAGKGPAAPGTFQGASFFGSYDMAGNVKEWCWNASGDKRYILGGDWTDPSYMFIESDGRSPFERGATFGFRCARYTRPIPEKLRAPVTRSIRDYSVEEPVSDDQFRAYKSLYSYDRAPLEEKIEATDDSDPFWRVETITFDAAYGHERVIAYLYLPKEGNPPYQTVVHFPAAYALFMDKIDSVGLHWIRHFVQSGRALLHPIYKGTYERRSKTPLSGPLAWRDQQFQWCKDLGRSIDYLETRRDIDRSKLAYQGISMGAIAALPCVAVEDRLQAAILQGGGLPPSKGAPEGDPINFAPRIRIPVLMINGKNDFDIPVERLQLPLFRLLGSAPADKRHFTVEGGHTPPRNLMVKEGLDWLDRYLGPVTGAP